MKIKRSPFILGFLLLSGVIALVGCPKPAPPKPPEGAPINAQQVKEQREKAMAWLDEMKQIPIEERRKKMSENKEMMRMIMLNPDPMLRMTMQRVMSGQADKEEENGEPKEGE